MALTKAKLEELFAAGDVAVSLADIASNVAGTSAQAMMDAKLELVSLWTNSAPTSSFAAQAVLLTLTGYTWIWVIALGGTGVQRTLPAVPIMVGGSGYLCFPASSNRLRLATVATTGVTFGATTVNAFSGGSTTDNAQVIPYKIYGVRKGM